MLGPKGTSLLQRLGMKLVDTLAGSVIWLSEEQRRRSAMRFIAQQERASRRKSKHQHVWLQDDRCLGCGGGFGECHCAELGRTGCEYSAKLYRLLKSGEESVWVRWRCEGCQKTKALKEGRQPGKPKHEHVWLVDDAGWWRTLKSGKQSGPWTTWHCEGCQHTKKLKEGRQPNG